VALFLVYIFFTYLGVFIHLYYVSKKTEYILVLQKSQNRDQLKKFWLTLAVSPLMYWFFYIWGVIVRLLQIMDVTVPIELIRGSIVGLTLVGTVYSLWVGYSSEIYVRSYRKLCLVHQEDLLAEKELIT